MLKDIKIDLLYQPLIDAPPQQQDLYKDACRGDQLTIDSWRDTWLKNYQLAKDHFGEISSKSYGQLYGINRQKPCIVIGSGPSLKDAIPALKANKEAVNPVMTISCLHNFGLLEDEGCHADYYLSLDSGGVVIDDIAESRNEDGKFYWDKTAGHKLIAYAASDPKLWGLWQGDLHLFNSLVPDKELMDGLKEIEPFTHYISSGGNAGGASFYTAKAVFCSDPIMLVGMDCCFDYDNTFHAYSTHYDTVGNYTPWPDIYGIPRKTWNSYLNFKFWWDDRVMKIPGNYINCSGGILGAYNGGNLRHYKYMQLESALAVYQGFDTLKLQQKTVGEDGAQSEEKFDVAAFYKNPQHEHDVTFF